VAAFVHGRMFGGDSGHLFLGSVNVEGQSVGAYFKMHNVVSSIPSPLGNHDYAEFHLRGQLEGVGDRILAQIQSSLPLMPVMVTSVEFRKKADFLDGGPLFLPRRLPFGLARIRDRRLAEHEQCEGFWTIEIKTERGTGTGVLLLSQGTALGGNSNYTFLGTTRIDKGRIKIRLLVTNFMTGGPNLFGNMSNCEIDITGLLHEFPSVTVHGSVQPLDEMETRVLEQPVEIRGNAVVVHRPDITGICQLKRKAYLPISPVAKNSVVPNV